jgi:hypothetical protein
MKTTPKERVEQEEIGGLKFVRTFNVCGDEVLADSMKFSINGDIVSGDTFTVVMRMMKSAAKWLTLTASSHYPGDKLEAAAQKLLNAAGKLDVSGATLADGCPNFLPSRLGISGANDPSGQLKPKPHGAMIAKQIVSVGHDPFSMRIVGLTDDGVSVPFTIPLVNIQCDMGHMDVIRLLRNAIAAAIDGESNCTDLFDLP